MYFNYSLGRRLPHLPPECLLQNLPRLHKMDLRWFIIDVITIVVIATSLTASPSTVNIPSFSVDIGIAAVF